MTYKIVPVSAQPVRRSLIAGAAAALMTVVTASIAFGQQPKPPAAQPRPAAPAPAQAQAAPAPAQPPQEQLLYSPWLKQCVKGHESGGKMVCITGRSAFSEAGLPMLSAVLIEPDGEKKLLRVTVPEPVALAPGTRIIVDQGQPMPVPYFTCLRNGCIAEVEAVPDMITKFKSGQTLFVQAVVLTNQVVSLPLPLADFKKVNEGPPSDPKVVEDQQKKLQDELTKRQDEYRKKLEAQQQQQQQAQPAAK
jgi:invasion protein IalB